jgi:hypothetical protein
LKEIAMIRGVKKLIENKPKTLKIDSWTMVERVDDDNDVFIIKQKDWLREKEQQVILTIDDLEKILKF